MEKSHAREIPDGVQLMAEWLSANSLFVNSLFAKKILNAAS